MPLRSQATEMNSDSSTTDYEGHRMSTHEANLCTAKNGGIWATYLAAGAAVFVGREGLMRAKAKAYNVVSSVGSISAPVSPGLLAGAAVAT